MVGEKLFWSSWEGSRDNEKSDTNSNDNKSDNNKNKDINFHSYQLRWLHIFLGGPGNATKWQQS